MKTYLLIATYFMSSLLSGCGPRTTAATKWEYIVVASSLEVMEKGVLGTPEKFNPDPTQFTDEIRRLANDNWEYQGVVHIAGNLQVPITYILFRRPHP